MMMAPESQIDPQDQIQSTDLSLSNPSLASLMGAVLRQGKNFTFRACGSSMSPFIRDSDLVTVTPLAKRMPSLGEVVAFIHPENGILFVHRVVEIKGDGYRLQGDNTGGRSDGLIPLDHFLGRVIQVERNHTTVRIGLGLERYLIGLMSRYGLLKPILSKVKLIVQRL